MHLKVFTGMPNYFRRITSTCSLSHPNPPHLLRRRNGAHKGFRSFPLALSCERVEVPSFTAVVIAHLGARIDTAFKRSFYAPSRYILARIAAGMFVSEHYKHSIVSTSLSSEASCTAQLHACTLPSYSRKHLAVSESGCITCKRGQTLLKCCSRYGSKKENDVKPTLVVLAISNCILYHTSTHSARASLVSLCTSAFRAARLLPMWPRNTRCTHSVARSDASHFRRAKRRNSLRFVPRHVSLCASSMLASLGKHTG